MADRRRRRRAELLPPVASRGRVLALDLGEARVGVAVSDAGQRVATAVETLARVGDRRAEHRRVADLAGLYEAVAVVVGLPRSLDGRLGPAARGVLEETRQLEEALGSVRIVTIDERLTSVVAGAALRAAGKPAGKQRAVVDQAAAVVLLQDWLDRRNAAEAAAGGRQRPQGGQL